MNQQEKDDYFSWVALLRRTRGRPKRNRKPIPFKREDEIDVRDEIAKFDNVNTKPESCSLDEEL